MTPKIWLFTILSCALFVSFNSKASTLFRPDSVELEQMDHLVSQSSKIVHPWSIQPISHEYMADLLEQIEPESTYEKQFTAFLKRYMNAHSVSSETSWLDLEARLGYSMTNSRPVQLLQIDAVSNPLLSGNEGMFSYRGHHGFLGMRVQGEWNNHLSFSALPTLRLTSNDVLLNDSASFYLPEALLTFRFNKFAMEAGRGAIRWGNGRFGHLLFSGDHYPLYLARLRSNEPVSLPGFLRFLGPMRFEAFFSQLDKNREFPHAKLIGMLFVFAPHPRLEFSLGQTVLYGGDGAPTNNPLVYFSEKVADASNPANRNFLISARYRIPGLEIEPYAEMLVEDCCDINFFNPRDVVNLYGIYFPRIDPSGKADFAFEWVRTNHITYRHNPYSSGYVYNGRNLGHPLGPDANGIYGILRYFHTPSLMAKMVVAYEIRGRLEYSFSKNDIRTAVPSFQAPEDRLWVRFKVDWAPHPGMHFSPEIGLERVTHEGYQLHEDHWQGTGGVEFRYVF